MTSQTDHPHRDLKSHKTPMNTGKGHPDTPNALPYYTSLLYPYCTPLSLSIIEKRGVQVVESAPLLVGTHFWQGVHRVSAGCTGGHPAKKNFSDTILYQALRPQDTRTMPKSQQCEFDSATCRTVTLKPNRAMSGKRHIVPRQRSSFDWVGWGRLPTRFLLGPHARRPQPD